MPSRRIDWYAPPQQIRQWGDPEPEHNDDHFHMFYDLAFVAGAYVAGLSLKADLSTTGVLTFIGLVFVMRDVWMGNVSRVSRFSFNSFAHSALDVVNLTLTMVMVLFMESTARIIDPDTGAALGLVLTFLAIKLLEIYRNWDVARHQVTNNGACWLKNSAIISSSAVLSCIAAVIYCVTSHSLEQLWVFFFVATLPQLTLLYFMIQRSKRLGTQELTFVPMSIRYVIHRNTEWSMLMLGESVFTLLIVRVRGSVDFYITFLAGCLTVSMVYIHHFANDERESDKHALRLKSTRGLAFEYSRLALSVSLVALGASFKVLVEESTVTTPLKPKYATLFGTSLGLSLLLADLSAILHDTGVEPKGFFSYFHLIVTSQNRVHGRNLARLWVLKLLVVAVAFSLPAMRLTARNITVVGCALAFTAAALAVLQSHRCADVVSLSRKRINANESVPCERPLSARITSKGDHDNAASSSRAQACESQNETRSTGKSSQPDSSPTELLESDQSALGGDKDVRDDMCARCLRLSDSDSDSNGFRARHMLSTIV